MQGIGVIRKLSKITLQVLVISKALHYHVLEMLY